MRIDLDGRIRNITLAPSNALAPLYEAVVNAIQSVQERWGESNIGEVVVRIVRQPTDQLYLDTGQPTYEPVSQFIIEDNGNGFTEANYHSFNTSDSTHKKNLGGKGVGRFLCLKAFNRVSIESTFQEGDQFKRRYFDFSLPNGIVSHECEAIEPTYVTTKVVLDTYKHQYQEHCPKGPDTIASHIAGHCLEYFLQSTCPAVFVEDDLDSTRINVNHLVSSEIIRDRQEARFSICNFEFRILHLRLAPRSHIKHSIHYCAHYRSVTSEDLSKKIVDLSAHIKDASKVQFVYAGYVSGNFLDDRVNPERTRFNMSYSDDPDMFGEVNWTALTTAAINKANSYLAPFVAPLSKEKVDYIKTFISTKAPTYRHLLKWAKMDILNIPPNLDDDQLEMELSRIDQKIRFEIKQKTKDISANRADTFDRGAIQNEIDELVEAVTDVGQSGLARYIAYRKIIIDLLEKSIQLNENNRYDDEDIIHSIIHPMRMTSDDLLSVDYQNLWIIDERLSYHSFLASDMRFQQIGNLKSDSLNRPDLLIFNNPLAFSETRSPLSSVVIVEFKKAARNNFKEDDNPISQVYGYVNEIRKGSKDDVKGRPLTVNQNTPFYCYIIADLTKTLRLQAENHGFRSTPDGLGYFHFNENYNSYTEIISFEKLLDNAKKRNRILFEKLGLT